MVARVGTIAFQGIEGVPVDVQVMVAPGKMGMQIVGLADKAVAESRERVQAALHASGLSLPPKRVTVNLAPADLPKEGSHYDLAIALGLMMALGAVPAMRWRISSSSVNSISMARSPLSPVRFPPPWAPMRSARASSARRKMVRKQPGPAVGSKSSPRAA